MASNATAWNDTSCGLSELFFFYSKNVFAFIYALLFLLGVPGNTLMFLVLIQGFQRKSGNHISRLTDPLFISIVVLDLLFFVFNIPVMFTNLIFKDWYLGHLLYIPSHCLSLWISFADLYTMLAISLIRYMAVIYPMSLIPVSQKHIAIVCMFIWAICLLFTTPFWIHYETIHTKGEIYCINQMAWNKTNLYLKLLGGVGFLFPTSLIIFCYSRIIFILRARRILSMHTASSLHMNWHAIMIAFVTMVMLVTMWLPYWLVIFFIKYNEFLATVPTYLVYHLTSFLAYANHCIHPIICFCLSSQFQTRLRTLFRRASQRNLQVGCIHIGKIDTLNNIS